MLLECYISFEIYNKYNKFKILPYLDLFILITMSRNSFILDLFKFKNIFINFIYIFKNIIWEIILEKNISKCNNQNKEVIFI